jgi:hypothetical protein
MSKRRFIAFTTAIVSALAVGASTAGAASDAFAGVWRATDQGDGSTLTLVVSRPAANGIRYVVEYDNYATACGGGPAIGYGPATVSGSTLTATLHVQCATGLTFDGAGAFQSVGTTLVTDGAVFTRLF